MAAREGLGMEAVYGAIDAAAEKRGNKGKEAEENRGFPWNAYPCAFVTVFPAQLPVC